MIFEIYEPPPVCCCSAHDGMAKAEVKWSDCLLAPNGSTTSNSGRCSNCQPEMCQPPTTGTARSLEARRGCQFPREAHAFGRLQTCPCRGCPVGQLVVVLMTNR